MPVWKKNASSILKVHCNWTFLIIKTSTKIKEYNLPCWTGSASAQERCVFLTCWHFQNINNENYSNGDIPDFSNQKVFGEGPTFGSLKKLSQHEEQNKSPGCCSTLEETDTRQLSETNHLCPDTRVSDWQLGAGRTGHTGWFTPTGLTPRKGKWCLVNEWLWTTETILFLFKSEFQKLTVRQEEVTCLKAH